jgi:hypothetical protein
VQRDRVRWDLDELDQPALGSDHDLVVSDDRVGPG